MYLLHLADIDLRPRDDHPPSIDANDNTEAVPLPDFDDLFDPIPEGWAPSPLFAMAVLAHLGPRPWAVTPAA